MAEDALNEMDLESMDLKDFKPEDVKKAREQLLEMMNDKSLSDEARENLKTLLGGDLPVFGAGGSSAGTLLGVTFAVVIFAIIFFFGYKLYKSIKDKELKREEKKKAKQMKKKK